MAGMGGKLPFGSIARMRTLRQKTVIHRHFSNDRSGPEADLRLRGLECQKRTFRAGWGIVVT